MGFTLGEEAFIGAHEQGINDLIRAFCTDRPRYLLYRSPAFGPATTVDATKLDPIDFPGIPGGIEWQVRLSIPEIDLYKQSTALPPELTLSPGQFSAKLGVQICLDCKTGRLAKRDDQKQQDRRKQPVKADITIHHPLREMTCWAVEVFAIGHIEPTATSTGAPAITFVVDAVEIVDIQPDELESLLECLLFMILQAAFAQILIPSDTFAFDPFIPVAGPLIEDDQIKLRGNL